MAFRLKTWDATKHREPATLHEKVREGIQIKDMGC